MPPINKYEVIVSDTMEGLQIAVEAKLATGWDLAGGCFMNNIGDYCQAITTKARNVTGLL